MTSGTIEKIGGVILDLSDYPGEDLYSEGAAEDRLLELVKEHGKDEYNRVIALEERWSTLYHLSHLRGNIVDFFPIRKDQRVLEIGAGCGAVTGTVASKAGHVTCIELSYKRSLINAYRNSEYDNIDIRVGNFQDIEKKLNDKYDYILLIGVLEYAELYLNAANPWQSFLELLSPHLATGGQIILAIENKYGMKYFAGCREDHTGRYYDGIEGYTHGDKVRTFSRAGLMRLFHGAGYDYKFFYPYPDYKLPITVYSDDRLPFKGEFNENARNFDGERMTAFSEGAAMDEALSDGYFPFFSNSFLCVLQKNDRIESLTERHPVYSKHSTERDPLFQIRTDIMVDGNHKKIVIKTPFTREAVPHLLSMADAYGGIKDEFAGTIFKPCPVRKVYDAPGNLMYLEFDYITGRSMDEELKRLLTLGRGEDCVKAIVNFAAALRRAAVREFWATREFAEVFEVTEVPGTLKSMMLTDVDLIFSNLIFNEGWNIIDYEWVFDFPVPVDFCIFRAVSYFLSSLDMAEPEVFDGIYEKIGIDSDLMGIFYEMEQALQRYIAGRHISLEGMYSIFGCENIHLEGTLNKSRLLKRPEKPRVFYDRGLGFHPGDSLLINAERNDEDGIRFETLIPEDCVSIRIDPGDFKCLVKIDRITIDGIPRDEILINGTGITENVIIYDTDDPQIIMEDVDGGGVLYISYHIAALDKRFWDPLAYEFDMPVDNGGSGFKHLIKGTRPEYIPMILTEKRKK
ncbi:MAG: class I SAM-dependent methyltransferase [Lachnospiraceae bacterium]|nr:class I SAM-dependent methyltransferase [Lachnospiraceae bacterium]